MTYRLVDVDPNDANDAQRLADMFNDFDSAWPGGFNRGSTETAQTVRAWLGRARRLAILAVESQGQFVGFCDLMPFPGDRERVYVDLLGARLAHHGRGVGKLLLLEMVRRTCEMGYRQLTLHTWAGNTKAVPLYKRTGFQWEPDSDVHMLNFMPTILAMPAARAFFSNADWYATQVRDLSLVPDDTKWHGMPAYEYRFQRGHDFLAVWIDRASERVTAVDTPRLLVGCTVPVEDVAAGEACPIEWVLQSHDGRPAEIVVAAHPGDGLGTSLHEQFTLQGETTLQRELSVAADAVPDRQGYPPHLVRTSVLVDGQPMELETGVKVTRPVAITVEGCGVRLGRTEQVRVKLRSRVDRDLRGRLTLQAHPALKCQDPSASFELSARSWTEHRFEVAATAAGVHVTPLRLEAGEMHLTRDVAFRALAGSEPLASLDPYEELAVLEDERLRVEAALVGGRVSIYEPGTDRKLASVPPVAVGPPFQRSHAPRPTLYRARVEKQDGATCLVLSRDCAEIDGLSVDRRILLEGGAVRLEHRVANSIESSRDVALRFTAGPEFVGRLTYPLALGLVREPFQGWGYFPNGSTDVVPVGGRLAESWAACDGPDGVAGLVWNRADEERLGWDSWFPVLTYELGHVPAHGAAACPAVWLVAGPGSWEAVRGWWRRTVQPAGVWEATPPTARRLLEVRTEPSPAVLCPDDEAVRVVLTSLRGNPQRGRIELGTGADAAPGLELGEAVLEVPETDRDRPFVADVGIRAPAAPFAALLRATARLGGQVSQFDLPVVRLATAGQVSVSEEEGEFQVDNGAMRYRVAPAFGGSVISLIWGGEERLRSSYPAAGPFMWAGKWYGGIHPNMGWIGASHLARDTFTGALAQRSGRRGSLWRGARVACRPAHRDLRWLGLEADYLTLPGSNVLLALIRWTNHTSARMTAEHDPCLAVWLAPGGREGTRAHWMREGRREVQQVGEFSRDMRSESWAAVADSATGRTALLVPGGRQARAYVEDFADNGQHLGVWGPMTLEPGETREVAAWLVLCQEPDLEAYAALGDAW